MTIRHHSFPETNQPPRRRRPARRGVALLMVLLVAAIAGIISWTLLERAFLMRRAHGYARAAVEAQSLAESGVHLAIHFLRYPEESPDELVQGVAGDHHWPGASNIDLGIGGSLTVEVTNPGIAMYRVFSTGRSVDPDGNEVSRTYEVTLLGVGQWRPLASLQGLGAFEVADHVTVEKGVATDGAFLGGNDVATPIYATNHAGKAGWSPAPALPELPVPPFSSLELVRGAELGGGKYVYDGEVCQADFILAGPVFVQPLASPHNKGRVFVYTGTTPLRMELLLNSRFDGTLVTTRAGLDIRRNLELRPLPDMPAAIIGGQSRISTTGVSLTSRGVYYARNSFTAAGGMAAHLEMLAPVLIEIMPTTTVGEKRQNTGVGFHGTMAFRGDPGAAASQVPNLTQQGIRYERIQILQWEMNDN